MVILTIILVQVLCYLYQAPKHYIEIWHERPFSLQLLLYFWLVSLVFYLISDRDCVAHRLSTSHLYFNIGIDFTGFFLDYDCVAWQVGRRPRGRPSAPPTSPLLPHIDPRRLVFVFTDRDAITDFVHRHLASRYSV